MTAKTHLRVLLSAAVVAASITACSVPQAASPSGSADCANTYKVDDHSIPVCGPLKLAVFLPGANNADLQSRIAYLNSEIPTIPGATMTIFDGKFDAATQINQIQNALQSGRFNAAIAAPVDGNLSCTALSQQAPAAGVLVGVLVLPICGRSANNGADLRAPGTLTFVGGTQSPRYWTDYLEWIATQNPGPQRFLALTDPAAPFPLTENFHHGVEAVGRSHPDFRIVGEAATDLTVAGSYEKMAALLQAHPDATGLVTMYSTESQGAVQALQAAGRLGSVKIYDKGATAWAVTALKSGQIAATSPELPVTSTATLLHAIIEARSGTAVPGFYGNDGSLDPNGSPTSGFTVFTAATIGSFKAEG